MRGLPLLETPTRSITFPLQRLLWGGKPNGAKAHSSGELSSLRRNRRSSSASASPSVDPLPLRGLPLKEGECRTVQDSAVGFTEPLGRWPKAAALAKVRRRQP